MKDYKLVKKKRSWVNFFDFDKELLTNNFKELIIFIYLCFLSSKINRLELKIIDRAITYEIHTIQKVFFRETLV